MMTMYKLPILLAMSLLAGCSVQGKLGGLSTSGSNSSSPSGAQASSSEFFTIPNLVGLSEADARKALADVGFTATLDVQRNTGCEYMNDWIGKDLPEGTVCQQHPAAGKRSGGASPVQLKLAGSREGDGFTEMPNLIGMHVDEATALLKKKGMTKMDVKTGNATCADPYIVCRQSPEPGHKAVLRYNKTIFYGAPPKEKVPEKIPEPNKEDRADDSNTDVDEPVVDDDEDYGDW